MTNRRWQSAGISILELIVAMFIGSIVLAGAYQAYRYFNVSADRERFKTLLQQETMLVGELIEKDIRRAGYGLPGNGLNITLSETCNDRLKIYFANEYRPTILIDPVQATDSVFLVQDCGGAKAGWSVCLAGADTVYCDLVQVGDGLSGPDTLYTDGPLGGLFTVAGTRVFLSSHCTYTVLETPVRALHRIQNGKNAVVGTMLDTFNIVILDSLGSVLDPSLITAASAIRVELGGDVGRGGNRTWMMERIEVKLRNRS